MANYLLEVGTEELPVDFIAGAIAQWKSLVPRTLAEQYLTPEAVEVYGSPRRLAVLIRGLPDKQPDREEEIKGPPAKAAFKDGEPTKAALGFARKQGVAVKALEVRPTPKGDFVFIQKQIPGRQGKDIVEKLSRQWIDRLEGKRFMRWGDGDFRFPRPIRSLIALWDEEVLPLELVNGSIKVKSDRLSSGHRVLHPEAITIAQAGDYLSSLQSAYISVDPQERQQVIEQQIEAVGESLGGKAEVYPDLLAEVTNLVEWPTAVAGKFDPEFLSLPEEVITTVMVTHQRYFPVKKNQQLLPYFITIANGDPAKADIIAAGNERVIRARLADGRFFYQADCKQHLESYLPQLEKVTFQEDLGSMKDKVNRLINIAAQIVKQLNLAEEEKSLVERVGLLCKADLVTQMVDEFPELQGVMGEKYALVSGESEAVAKGIFEHYLPRGAGDIMPATLGGQVVGLADRLDTLTSIFGLGMIPTGSSDPFALRRAANAVINITWQANLGINLGEIIQQSSQDFVTANNEHFDYPSTTLRLRSGQALRASAQCRQQTTNNKQLTTNNKQQTTNNKQQTTNNEQQNKQSLVSSLSLFFIQRIRTLLQDELGIDYDLVNAVLAEDDPEYGERAIGDLLDVRDRALFLQEIRQNGILAQIYETVNRSTRLGKQGDLGTEELNPETVVNKELFEKSSEAAFYQALVQLLPQTKQAQQERNYQLLVDGLKTAAPIVTEFFDGENSVLVMAENEDVRRNRLNLLALLRNHARVLADFGGIVKPAVER